MSSFTLFPTLEPSRIQTNVFDFNFPQPMQVQITTKVNQNFDYNAIANDFFSKYSASSYISLSAIGHYYVTSSLITLVVHKGDKIHTYELLGPEKFSSTMSDLGTKNIRYENTKISTQPIDDKGLLVTIHGQIVINNHMCNSTTSLLIKIVDDIPRIFHQIINIFL